MIQKNCSRQHGKFFILVASIASLCAYTSRINAFELAGSSFYAARSQSVNTARDLPGFCQFLTRSHCGFEGMLLAVPGYECSFQSPRIAQYFFNNNEIRITGSRVANRTREDLLADYFGLSPAFASSVIMNPRITSSYINFETYLSYNAWYIRIIAPVCSSKWNYQLDECISNSGTGESFPEHYMASSTVQEPVTSFKQAICGHHLWGDVQTGLVNSIICGPQSVKGLADLRILFGFHIIRNERYYLGINIIGAAPTGSHINGTYFFEPIVGNGHHWEIGAGLDGRVLAWQATCDHSLSLYGTIHATHLCRSTQRRSFDFCINGFASRYLLLKQFDANGTYNGNLVPASSITTLPCNVWSAGQFDIVAMLGYRACGLEIDFGYNAWIRTREHICIRGSIPENRYGIKGIQDVVDELGNPNNLTQSTATIHGNELTPAEQAAVADPHSPVFIRTEDLDPRSAASTAAFTNKFFTHVGYAFPGYHHIEPYLGLGGEVEFEGIAPEHNRQANHNTVAQWGIWLKGGALFA